MVDDIVIFSDTQGGLQLLLTCYDLVDQMGQCINAVKTAEFSLEGIKLAYVIAGIYVNLQTGPVSMYPNRCLIFFLKYDSKINPKASFDLRTPPRMC